MLTSGHLSLVRDHAAIDALARRLTRQLDTGAESAALAQTLGDLVRVVRDHLASEDAMIYTLAMEERPGTDVREVRRVQAEFERLKCDWAAYLTEWSAAQIERDRRGFDRATRAMIPRLRDRVSLENTLLGMLGPARTGTGSAPQSTPSP